MEQQQYYGNDQQYHIQQSKESIKQNEKCFKDPVKEGDYLKAKINDQIYYILLKNLKQIVMKVRNMMGILLFFLMIHQIDFLNFFLMKIEIFVQKFNISIMIKRNI